MPAVRANHIVFEELGRTKADARALEVPVRTARSGLARRAGRRLRNVASDPGTLSTIASLWLTGARTGLAERLARPHPTPRLARRC